MKTNYRNEPVVCDLCSTVQVWYSGHGAINLVEAIRSEILKIRELLSSPTPDFNGVATRLDKVEKISGRFLEYESPFVLKDVNICELVENRVNELRRIAQYRHVIYRSEMKRHQNCFVRANPLWLQRVLDIIVDNGVEATEDRVNPVIQVFIHQRAQTVVLVVTDNGRGIDDNILNTLFKRPSGMRRLRGRGLYVARTILEVYGGNIGVNNTGPEGTTMGIWLPIIR